MLLRKHIHGRGRRILVVGALDCPLDLLILGLVQEAPVHASCRGRVRVWVCEYEAGYEAYLGTWVRVWVLGVCV